MKRLLYNTLIIIIMMGVCFNGCFDFGGLSVSNRFSYASADNWSSCDSSDLVTAFRYYCKSRNLALEGSYADALTTFTTTTFNNICSTIGIDPTSLQAELKKTTEGNLGLRFLFSITGITAYNRIFAEFLQNNDLSVGDEVDNKQLYSGDYFTDNQGNSCLVYVISSRDNAMSFSNGMPNRYILKYGTPYRFIGKNFFNSHSAGEYVFNVNDVSFTIKVTSEYVNSNPPNGYIYRNTTQSSNYAYQEGNCAIVKYNNEYYLGVYSKGSARIDKNNNVPNFVCEMVKIDTNKKITDGDTENVDINVTTNNTTINNNSYNNNYTIIYNEGDTYVTDDPDEPLPTTPPGGGSGGGGGDDPTNPDPDNPLDPYDPDKQFPDTPDNPTYDPGVHGGVGSDGTITFPDFNFDIPEINWSLDGLQHKFPFSLPFDLYNCCKLLNAEPETPELDYTVNLVVYDWRVNYDLHWLDPAARVIRIFELLAFVVGLILITRRLIGG